MRYREISKINESVNQDSLRPAITDMLGLMRKNQGRTPSDWGAINDDDSGGLWFDVRYWGTWVVPADAEDDGDYDWEEPSPETVAKLQQLIREVERNHPNVKITFRVGEKHWLEIWAKPK